MCERLLSLVSRMDTVSLTADQPALRSQMFRVGIGALKLVVALRLALSIGVPSGFTLGVGCAVFAVPSVLKMEAVEAASVASTPSRRARALAMLSSMAFNSGRIGSLVDSCFISDGPQWYRCDNGVVPLPVSYRTPKRPSFVQSPCRTALPTPRRVPQPAQTVQVEPRASVVGAVLVIKHGPRPLPDEVVDGGQ